MILGVGVDLVSVERMQAAIARWEGRLVGRLFTTEEVAACQRRARPEVHLAARFAAKEALLKAIGIGWGRGAAWREVEVQGTGAPLLCLRGRVQELAAARGVQRTHLSMSHDGGYAIAVVVVSDV